MSQYLRQFCVLLTVIIAAGIALGQAPSSANPVNEKERLDAALAAAMPAEKAELLIKFIADFPKSESLMRAKESLAGARAAMADALLNAGDVDSSLRLFRLVIDEAPKPYPSRLFTEVIATIPQNLFWRGHQTSAVEMAERIEASAAGNADQLLILSTFYLGTENGGDAKRLAEAALAIDEKSPAAHQALAAAHRLNFDLAASAASLTKALELDPGSSASKRSLADMKRALGKADEAEALYREVLAVNDKDVHSRTGLVLALFDQGKTTVAETEMARTLEEAPGNVVLLGSAAYWYAVNGNGEKAVEFARQAIAKEPRYVWSHIALGRGLMLQKKPVEAEQILLAARKYGNFPTLQYEIASARLAAGFFKEAADELRRSFSIDNSVIRTRLGGRLETEGGSFLEAIGAERRASIFAPNGADTTENAERMKALLEFDETMRREAPDEGVAARAAQNFAAGTDNMAVHRKLFAADQLLQKNVSIDTAVELTRAATNDLERALDVADPGAAVMANELYEARNVSFQRDEFLLIPSVPKQTLSALMRGRVEDTMGLALLKQGKPEEAEIRFRRALTVFPKDSAWWRTTTWNLGTALQAKGSDAEALETLISSYKFDKPNLARYMIIESLYRKVNGNLDGIEEKVGPNPLPNFSASANPGTPVPADTPTESPATVNTPPVGPPVSTEPITLPTPNPLDNLPKTLPIDRSAEIKVKSEPAVEPSPVPSPEAEKPAEGEPKTDGEKPLSEDKSEPLKPVDEEASKKEEVPAETKPPEKVVEEKTELPKNLFEPIVIPIRRNTPEAAAEKRAEVKTEPVEEKPSEPPVQTEAIADAPETPKTDAEPSDANARPRLVTGKPVTGDIGPACTMELSQENVSLINSGGNLGVLVSFNDAELAGDVEATSSSPTDIAVERDAGDLSLPSRRLYVIRSASDKTGVYQVKFRSGCGEKTVTVSVR